MRFILLAGQNTGRPEMKINILQCSSPLFLKREFPFLINFLVKRGQPHSPVSWGRSSTPLVYSCNVWAHVLAVTELESRNIAPLFSQCAASLLYKHVVYYRHSWGLFCNCILVVSSQPASAWCKLLNINICLNLWGTHLPWPQAFSTIVNFCQKQLVLS